MANDRKERLIRVLREQIRRHPPVHRAAKEILVGYKLLRLRQKRRGQSEPDGWAREAQRFASDCEAEDYAQLRASLVDNGVAFNEGRHTIYLPPQEAAKAQHLLPADLLRAYPSDAGFKILKRFSAPQYAHYLYESDAAAEREVYGGIDNQAYAAAAMYTLGLGPRPYGIVHLSGRNADLTILVCAHVAGEMPTAPQHADFLREVQAAEAQGLFELANPSRYDCGDWAATDCNRNLIWSQGRPQYVDPQSLIFDRTATLDATVERHKSVLHFGDVQKVVSGGQKFLYQDVPGYAGPARRDTHQRWVEIANLLGKHGASWQGRPVFDVCCNSGMIMHRALMSGASWAYGWDLPAVAQAADELLSLAGSGRSTLQGCSIDDETDFAANLGQRPVERAGVCFFLAAWHHVDFPQGVDALDWRWLVYEGKENESAEQTRNNLEKMQSRWNCELVETTHIRDGISQARPLALLRRC